MLTPEQLNRVVIVLVAARNPNNIGAAARAMSNFGFAHLRIVTTYDVPFHDARSAVGAAHLLAAAQQFATLEEAIADCSLVVGTTAVGERELHHSLHRLESAGSLIHAQLAVRPITVQASAPVQSPMLDAQSCDPAEQPFPLPSSSLSSVALLFGSEKTGLSKEDLSHCHWLLRVPTRGEHRSMNLGQAVALCLYELIRESEPAQSGASAARPANSQPATAGELDRLLALLLRTLEAVGYIKANADPAVRQKIRRLILRLNPAHGDAEILMGMLRQVLWKLNSIAPPSQ